MCGRSRNFNLDSKEKHTVTDLVIERISFRPCVIHTGVLQITHFLTLIKEVHQMYN